MAQSAFPLGDTVCEPDRDPRVVSVDDAGTVIEALASETARQLLGALIEEPLPPSTLAETVNMSLQNVTYHLNQLHDAGVIDVVDTWYSSRGSEMDVYAPVADPIVIRLGDEDSEQRALQVVDTETESRTPPVSSD